MRIRATLMSVLFILSVLVAAAQAAEYSADFTTTSKEGDFSGKMFIKENKMRMEMPEAITITRMDKKVGWMLLPNEKIYMEVPLRPSDGVISGDKMPGELSRKLIGPEAVGDMQADKFELVIQSGQGQETVFLWVAKESSIPVKTAAVDNAWSITYSNIVKAEQPESIFELPEGYTLFSYDMAVPEAAKPEAGK
ncbi:MAG TPA: hypothetical protein P5110_02300 [Candidatus Omnitrophota bacterium]|nr:hypothetical protein [Candidatus Omnitrophota bacterium]HRZ14318.1 hypothetical protein [Candidatus Omnitrophota bacterium]